MNFHQTREAVDHVELAKRATQPIHQHSRGPPVIPLPLVAEEIRLNMAQNIAEVLAMLLPAGLLFDSPEIYAEVAKLPVVPLEDVRRHWKCMTTETSRGPIQEDALC